MKIQLIILRINNNRWLQKGILVLIVGLLWFSLINPYNATGQSSDQPWTTPINLSHSGSTSNPAIVSMPDKTIYAIWQDAYSGSVYSRWDGSLWSKPKAVKFPFDTYKPRLVSNSNGRIYAFWTDSQGALFRSYAEEPYFGEAKGWAAPRQVSDSALDFDVSIDDQNQIHLAYIHSLETSDTPAGIYFLHTNDTITFSDPVSIYQSPYFRGLDKNLANVQIAVTGKGQATKVYLVWDNPLRKQIFFANSGDGGKTWGQPQEIENLNSASGSNIPFRIRVSPDSENVLLIWQNGDLMTSKNIGGTSGATATGSISGNCNQLYQSSTDGGKTWSKSQGMFKELNACVQDFQFFPLGNKLTLVMITTTQNQVYLVAWDGNAWGSLQSQPTLSGFEDPEINSSVKFGCRQTSQVGIEELVVIGCDTGVGGDIWVTNRNLGSIDDWYPSPSAWKPPISIATSQSEILSPIAIAYSDGMLNALWNQFYEPNLTSRAIYIANMNGERWSTPAAILSSPEGKTGLEAAKLDSKGRLLVTWSGGNSGQIYFSWANTSKAVNKSEWTSPQPIPTPGQGATSPNINSDQNGVIYIVYDIPLNEQRGLFIDQSTDGGNTWSDPVKIFDAAAAGWDMVGQPQLAFASDGSLHVFWTRYTLPGGDGPLGLYGAHSEDNGKTWSAPETMAEGTTQWSQALGTENGPLQLVWLEQNSGRQVIKHMYSLDNGKTWNRTSTTSNIMNIQGNPSATADIAGRLHLIVVSQDNNQYLNLIHLMWDGQRWISDDSYEIGKDSTLNVSALSTDISPAGKLDVVYSGVQNNAVNNSKQYNIFYTSRSIDMPKTAVFNIIPTSLSNEQTLPEQTPTPTLTPEIIPSPSPTPERSTQISQIQASNPSSNSNYSGLILGAGLAAVVVILIIGLLLRTIRTRRG